MDSKLEIVLTAKDITGKAFKQLTGRLDAIKRSVFSLQGGLVTLAGGYGLKSVATAALDVAASFEQMQVKLDVLTRGKGTETLEKINQWALDMPVNTMKAVDTFAMMQAMGLDPTIAKMETLVDVAAIFGDDAMPRVARAMGQMQSLGKLTAQDLNQMAEVGINARKYLKEALGMTVEEVQKSGMEIDKVVQVIWDGLNADFAGASKKAQKSWQGMTATFKSYMVEISRTVMEAGVFDEMKTQLSGVNTEVAAWLKTNEELIRLKVPEYIDKVTGSVKGLVGTYNALPDEVIGAAGAGIIGRILFGSTPAGQMATIILMVNQAMANLDDTFAGYDFSLQKVVEDSQEFSVIMSRIWEVLSGKRDANTGLLKGQFADIFNLKQAAERSLRQLESLPTQNVKVPVDLEVEVLTPIVSEDAAVNTTKALNALWTKIHGINAAEVDRAIKVHDYWLDYQKDKLDQYAEEGAKIGKDFWLTFNEGMEAANERSTELEYLNNLEDIASEIDDIWKHTAENMQDVFADAFSDMAKSGALFTGDMGNIMKTLGTNIANTATDMSSQMMAAYARMAVAAETSAAQQKAAMMATGWGVAAIAAGYLYSKYTADGGGSEGSDRWAELNDTLKQLIDSLNDNTQQLKAIDLSGIESQWWPDIYDMARDFSDNIETAIGGFINAWSKTGDMMKDVIASISDVPGLVDSRFSLLAPAGQYGTYTSGQDVAQVLNTVTGEIDLYTLEEFAALLAQIGIGFDSAASAAEYITAQLENFYTQVAAVLADLTETFDEFVLSVTDDRTRLQKSIDDAWGLYDEAITALDKLREQGAWIDQAVYEGLAADLTTALKAIYAEPFQGILDSMQSARTATMRSTWGSGDWQGYLADQLAQYNTLDPETSDYYDRALAIYEDSWLALQNIERLNEQQYQELQNLQTGIGNLIDNISGGGALAPVQSVEYFTGKYQDLLNKAMGGDSGAAKDFTGFASDYLEFMKSYTPNYQAITDYVLDDLGRVQATIAEQMSELDLLNDTNTWLSDLYDLLDERLQGVIDGVSGLTIETMPGFAGGGRTSGPSLVGEAGIEWVAPTADPARSRFLAETGVQAALDQSIARILPAIASGCGEGTTAHIHLHLDGREICNVVARGLGGRHQELIKSVRRAV